MKIDNYVKQVNPDQQQEAVQKKDQKPEPKGDSVKLSPRAKELQKANADLKNVPDIDEDKVNKLKNEIQNGTYEVKPDEIAEKMIKESIVNQFV